MVIDVTSLYDRRADNRWDRVCIGDIFERVAISRPNSEALIGAPGAYATPEYGRLTYGQADAIVNQVANALLDRGLQRGDRVFFICDNSVEAFIAKIGVAKAGCVAVPVNPSQTPEVIIDALRLTEPKFVIADAGALTLIRGCFPVLDGVDVTIPLEGDVISGSTSFVDFHSTASTEPPDVTVHGDDIWEILFTSGTTAMPKGVMISHTYGYITALTWALSHTRGLLDESHIRFACFFPIQFHVGDQGYTMPALFAGGTLILGRRYDPVQMSLTLKAERATGAIGGHHTLVDRVVTEMEKLGQGSFSALRVIVFGGGGLVSPELRSRIEAICPDVNLLCIAGQTESVSGHRWMLEAFPEVYADSIEDQVNVVGRPAPLMGAEIVSLEDGTTPVQPGTTGELVYRSPVMMSGYYRDQENTEKAFAGGWFHSGDLAHSDEDGFRVIVGRIKDMIKSGGENVSAARVESVIASHPDVRQVAVVGLPDERWGEAVTAAVVPIKDDHVNEEQLRQYCRERLAAFEAPKRIVFLDKLPTDFIGKVRKYTLRQSLSDQLSL